MKCKKIQEIITTRKLKTNCIILQIKCSVKFMKYLC